MKALVGAFNQEKALVGAFSVIVKTGCGTDGSICGTNRIHNTWLQNKNSKYNNAATSATDGTIANVNESNHNTAKVRHKSVCKSAVALILVLQ